MNSILKKSFGLVLVLFLMVFCLSSVVKVRATEYTSTVIFDGSGLTTTATSADTAITVNGFNYTVSKGAKSTSSSGSNRLSTNAACLIGKNGTYIYNTSPFQDGITSFEIFANSGASTNVSVGVFFSIDEIESFVSSGSNTWTSTLSTTNNVYNCSSKIPTGAKYFWYQVTNAYNSQVQFRITYNDRGDNNHCFVLFDSNGGEGTMAGQKVQKSTETSLANCTFTPPTDKQFAGWATSADGEVVYNNGASITINETTILYAKWVDAAGPTLLESVSITNGDIDLKAGQTEQVNLLFTPSNASNKNVTYQITNGNTYASVDENGLVTALAAGVATLTVTPADTNADPVNCTITVTNYPAPAISPGNYIIYANDSHGNYQLSGVSENLGTAATFENYPNDTVYPVTVLQGAYVNTIAFKTEDDKYLSLTINDNKLTVSDEINEESTWFVTENDQVYTVTHFTTSRILRFNYASGNPRFACYTSGQTAISFFEVGQTSVTISSTSSTAYLGGTLSFEVATNAEEPYDVDWDSSDETVATINANGVLTPVAIGTTTISATINGSQSNEIVVKVYPNPENTITCAQANSIANVTGSSATTETYTVEGTFTYVDANNFTITDASGSININKYGHGLTNSIDGRKLQVSGKVIKYQSETNRINGSSITRYYIVTINYNNGEENDYIEVLSNNVVQAPADPVKDGFSFGGWKDDEDQDWNFTSTITRDMTITAQWVNSVGTSIINLLNSTQAYMSLAYKYSLNSPVVIDTLNRELTGRPNSTSYGNWNDKTSTSSAVFNGNSAGDKDTIQLRSTNNSGIITTLSGGYARVVKITFHGDTADGRTIDIYGKDSAYSATSDLYGDSKGTLLGKIIKGTSTTLYINGEYEYIGIRSNNGACYLTEVQIMWSGEFDDADFRIRCGFDSTSFADSLAAIDNQAIYGIEVKAGANTYTITSDEPLFVIDNENNMSYVLVDLGDILTNLSRMSVTFNVRPYVELNSTKYYATNGERTASYSVANMVNQYHNNVASAEQVQNIYNLLVTLGILS